MRSLRVLGISTSRKPFDKEFLGHFYGNNFAAVVGREVAKPSSRMGEASSRRKGEATEMVQQMAKGLFGSKPLIKIQLHRYRMEPSNIPSS
jgi:hypothetical protein